MFGCMVWFSSGTLRFMFAMKRIRFVRVLAEGEELWLRDSYVFYSI
ncbi:hypothetical protein MtrunA17_Chr8g0346381 [Medicago truncatula]|uniref:Uncharacterized protein n=1 Tax=Medicago truncatula TaxID=3880 RepID=A0A396GLY3_MEDTR|nr:hypothetical protein MtrunA17_Chr8g0346381 [Medicago truncatula]